MVNLYEKVSSLFHDPDFVLETMILPKLHHDFATSKKLKLGDYTCTREISKKLMVQVCPRSAKKANIYELIGAREG